MFVLLECLYELRFNTRVADLTLFHDGYTLLQIHNTVWNTWKDIMRTYPLSASYKFMRVNLNRPGYGPGGSESRVDPGLPEFG